MGGAKSPYPETDRLTPAQIHDKAMELCDYGDDCRRSGDEHTAKIYFGLAWRWETEASKRVPGERERSILMRSAECIAKEVEK